MQQGVSGEQRGCGSGGAGCGEAQSSSVQCKGFVRFPVSALTRSVAVVLAFRIIKISVVVGSLL